MFKKPIISHHPDANHLISKVPGEAFKKGTTLKVAQGYEAILMDQDGSLEVIKNTYELKLDRLVYYIYFAKSNRKIIKTNWGTPNRIQLETKEGKKTLGAFGATEFQLKNPIRFITTRMNEDLFVDELGLAKLVLSRIPELFHQVVPSLEPLEIAKESVLTNQFKETLTPLLSDALDDLGIELKSFMIDNVNFKDVEGA